MHSNKIRIALAQPNLITGDIAGNRARIIGSIKDAHDQLQADIIIFPELSITSYPPEDLLLRPGLYDQIEQSLLQIITDSNKIDIVLGYPEIDKGKIFNTCSLLREGSIVTTYHKQLLPNYSVFDEKRYFEPGNETCVFDLNGIPTALSICEDIWEPGLCAKARFTSSQSSK